MATTSTSGDQLLDPKAKTNTGNAAITKIAARRIAAKSPVRLTSLSLVEFVEPACRRSASAGRAVHTGDHRADLSKTSQDGCRKLREALENYHTIYLHISPTTNFNTVLLEQNSYNTAIELVIPISLYALERTKSQLLGRGLCANAFVVAATINRCSVA